MNQNDHSENDNGNSEYKSNELKNHSIIKESEKTDKSANNSNNPSKNKITDRLNRFWIIFSINDRIQIILAIITFLTLIAFIVFSGMQYYQTRESLKETVRINNFLKETTEYDIRAYCGINPTIQFYDTEIGQKPYVTFSIKNFGKTPAYNVRIKTMIGFVDGMPRRSDIPNNIIDGFMIGSEDQTAEQFTYIESVTDNITYNKMISGNIKLFIIGCVKYMDIFKKERIFYFGAYYNPIIKKAEGIPGFMYAD